MVMVSIYTVMSEFFLALMVMKLRHDIMGSEVGGCVDVPGTCVLKMMLHYGTLSWKLRHVMMGVRGEGGRAQSGWPCVIWTELGFQFVFWQSLAPATPNEFYLASLKRLLRANWLWHTRKENNQLWTPWNVRKLSNPMVQKPDMFHPR